MPIRAVFDTNVFVAALLKTSGLTARLISLWQADYLVTNNKQHFQDAGITEFHGVHVISISEFLELMGLV